MPEANFMRQTTDQKTRFHGHVLLAEDDLIVQMVTKRVLEQAAYSVELVANGHEAIKALTSADYDLVLMDGSMPVMDGFEATRIIRDVNSAVRWHGIPIIALTGLTTEADRERCIRAGMDDYVSKPVDPGVLIATIEHCLDKKPDDTTSLSQQHTKEKQNGNNDFRDTLIDKFLEEVPQVVTDLQAAIGQEDVIRLKDIAHRLRGPTDLLGAATLSARSSALEKAAKTGDLIPAIQCAYELIEELQFLIGPMTDE